MADWIHVEVMDDGAGTTEGELAATSGHGLVGMRERVELLGGELNLNSPNGAGMEIDVRIPLTNQFTFNQQGN